MSYVTHDITKISSTDDTYGSLVLSSHNSDLWTEEILDTIYKPPLTASTPSRLIVSHKGIYARFSIGL